MKTKLVAIVLLLTSTVSMYSQNKMLSKEQAISDIDSLVYTISEVHPDMFLNCKPGEFMKMTSDIKNSIQDSVSLRQLYTLLQPLIVKIGDGHTSLIFPFNDVMDEYTLRLPMNLNVTPDDKVKVVFSVGDKVPAESEIVKINGITVEEMFNKMLCYKSGESKAYKKNRIHDDFYALFFILYSSDTYEIEYVKPGCSKTSKINLNACTNKEYFDWKKKTQPSSTPKEEVTYSFKIVPGKSVAIMDFKSFDNPSNMESFADSMFTTLRKNDIRNLIIDVRENGGGDSTVGDMVLSYISNKPFSQFEKLVARVTPTSQKLMRRKMDVGWYYYEVRNEDMVQPKTTEKGHYNGNVYLLTSNHTFSSASSFSWTFKEFGMGKVIGEETGGVSVCFGDVLYYKLPQSGITASMSYKCFWQYGANENDIHGTIPDYIVPKEDALAKALKLCSQVNGKGSSSQE